MKKVFLLLYGLLLCLPVLHAQDSTRVLLISLDGISAEGLKTASTPHLDALMADGVYSWNTRNVIPSVTLPNWTSHLCGSGPERHGVLNNSWTTAGATLTAVSKDADGYYPSIFKVIREAVPEVKIAFYYNWASLINAFNPAYMDEVNYLADDAFTANFERAFEFMQEHRSQPTLTFLYDVHVDHAGHSYGWMSPEYLKALEEADEQVGILLQKMKLAGLYNQTYIFFVTDHGGINKNHGGYTTQEMDIPWSLRGPEIKPAALREQNFTVNTASMVAHLFGVEQPSIWSGNVLMSVFGGEIPSLLPSTDTDDVIYYGIKNKSTATYLGIGENGMLCPLESWEEGSCNWYFLQTKEDGYLLVNKTRPDQALGEKEGLPVLVDKDAALVWYLCPDPENPVQYSITQHPDATDKCLAATVDNIIYWQPSATNREGLFWELVSDDPRTQVGEKRKELKEKIGEAQSFYALMERRVDDKIVGSFRAESLITFGMALEQARQQLDCQACDAETLSKAISDLEQALSDARNASTVEFEDGAVYQIQNADPRFVDSVYMYVNAEGTVRWGVKNRAIEEACYRWKVMLKDDHLIFYNVGTKKYLGSSAWDNARPSKIVVTDTPLQYELNNTTGTDLREWTMRSVDSEEVKNPKKSFLACTDDNDKNLTDGRVLPWDPTDATAKHDGFWKFEKVPVVTGLEQVIVPTAGALQVKVKDHRIYVEGVTDYSVYDLKGRSLAKQAVLSTGVYLVLVEGTSYKVFVE